MYEGEPVKVPLRNKVIVISVLGFFAVAVITMVVAYLRAVPTAGG